MSIMQVDIIIKSIILIVNLLLLFTAVYSYRQQKKSLEQLSDEADTIENKIDSMWFDLEK